MWKYINIETIFIFFVIIAVIYFYIRERRRRSYGSESDRYKNRVGSVRSFKDSVEYNDESIAYNTGSIFNDKKTSTFTKKQNMNFTIPNLYGNVRWTTPAGSYHRDSVIDRQFQESLRIPETRRSLQEASRPLETRHSLQASSGIPETRRSLQASNDTRNNPGRLEVVFPDEEPNIYSTSIDSIIDTLPPINNDRYTMKKKKKKNKSEEKCREIFENLFLTEFKSIRPDWLKNPATGKNLEIDGFAENIATPLGMGLGFEYNGAQHSKYVPHFHGIDPKNFVYQAKKDIYKEQICKKRGILLIIIPHFIPFEQLEKYIKESLVQKGVLV